MAGLTSPMFTALATWIDRVATGRVAIAVALGALLCVLAFAVRERHLPSEYKVLDGRWYGYTADDVDLYFKAMDADQRNLYAWTQLTLDVAFPLLYGFLLAIGVSRYILKGTPSVYLLLPILAIVADLIENVILAYLALQYPVEGTTWPTIACYATWVKFGSIAGSVIVIVHSAYR